MYFSNRQRVYFFIFIIITNPPIVISIKIQNVTIAGASNNPSDFFLKSKMEVIIRAGRQIDKSNT